MSLIQVYHLKSILPDICITIPDLFWLQFAWNIFHSHTVCVHRYNMILLYEAYSWIMFFHFANLWLLIGELNQFTLKVIAYKGALASSTLLSVYHMSHSFLSLIFSLLFSLAFSWYFCRDTLITYSFPYIILIYSVLL